MNKILKNVMNSFRHGHDKSIDSSVHRRTNLLFPDEILEAVYILHNGTQLLRDLHKCAWTINALRQEQFAHLHFGQWMRFTGRFECVTQLEVHMHVHACRKQGLFSQEGNHIRQAIIFTQNMNCKRQPQQAPSRLLSCPDL